MVATILTAMKPYHHYSLNWGYIQQLQFFSNHPFPFFFAYPVQAHGWAEAYSSCHWSRGGVRRTNTQRHTTIHATFIPAANFRITN